MHSSVHTLCVFTLLFPGMMCNLSTAQSSLPRATPESQGISSADLLAYIEEADSNTDAMNSIMLLRHGKVVAEGWWSPYSADDPHMLYSLSKSFTSTAVGLAIAEGKLNLFDPVAKFFPNDVPAESAPFLQSMRIRDLLTMSTGQRNEDISRFKFDSKEPLTKAFLAMDVPHKPGTHFFYNTAATYMASAIVQEVTGEKVVDYLRPRLFDPLGIHHPKWGESDQGISLGGYGLNLMTEDIAKFGQLCLQRGKWGDKQLVPDSWVSVATSRQMSNGSNPNSDWEQGYGFQFWQCRHGLYRGDGAHGQYCIVMPQYDSVLAITSGTRDMGSIMELAWKHLLPAMKDSALPENPSAARQLKQRLTGLNVALPEGKPTSDVAARVSGQVFRYEENECGTRSISLTFSDAGATLSVQGRGTSEFKIGKGSWGRARTDSIATLDLRRVADGSDQGYAAAGAWQAPDTYVAKFVYYETPFYATLTFKFGDSTVQIDQSLNVSRGEKLPLAGSAILSPAE